LSRVVVTDQKQAPLFCHWLSLQVGDGEYDPNECRTVGHMGIEDGKPTILSVVAFNRWMTSSCDATIATNGSPRAASRLFVWTVYDFVFRHANKTRLNLIVRPDNAKSIALQHNLGHTLDCTLKDHYGEGQDALLFSCTRDQWRSGKWANPSRSTAPDR